MLLSLLLLAVRTGGEAINLALAERPWLNPNPLMTVEHLYQILPV
jgi:hypothetical protein